MNVWLAEVGRPVLPTVFFKSSYLLKSLRLDYFTHLS